MCSTDIQRRHMSEPLTFCWGALESLPVAADTKKFRRTTEQCIRRASDRGVRQRAPGMLGITCYTRDSLAACVRCRPPGPHGPESPCASRRSATAHFSWVQRTAWSSQHGTLQLAGASKAHGADDRSAGKKPSQRRPERQPRALLQHRPVAAQRRSSLLRARSPSLGSPPPPGGENSHCICISACLIRLQARTPPARVTGNRSLLWDPGRACCSLGWGFRAAAPHQEQVALAEAGGRALILRVGSG